jgi:ADP-ribosylglycohydrolase
MNRRTLLRSSVLPALSAAASPDVPLREKFFGCIAAVHIGSSMGATVEGWPWPRIEKEHGTLTRLLPYQHYRNGWNREPGTTEDGVERQKLMITAIVEKQDRISAEDLRRIWVRDIKHPGMVSEPFEAVLLQMAQTHIPAAHIGQYTDYSGLVSMSRSCHPIGLINAGDPASALADTLEVGQIYHAANSRALQWATVTNVAIAAATRPGATVDTVLGAVFDHCDRGDRRFVKDMGIRSEIERALKLADKAADFKQLRQAFDAVYSGSGIPYAHSYANEVLSKALAIFRLVKGDTWQAMVAGVNFGRDTDCLTAVAAGISGALSGGASIPADLVKQVDHAASINTYTNSRRTIRETSDALLGAFQARLRRLRSWLEPMEAAATY